MDIKPLISIVTICFNAEKFIEQTICSVIEQSFKNIEYIIIDGKSTDRSLEIINKYRQNIKCIISEIDSGIADAMNKGIAISRGDFIFFLHADDYLINTNILEESVKLLGSEDIAMFDILYGSNSLRLTPRGFHFWMNFKTGVFHQAVLCRRSVFDQVGGFDTEFKIAMDYDFFLRAYQNGMTARRHPLVLSVMRDTGISSRQDRTSLAERLAEEKKIHLKNCTTLSMSLVYAIYWPLYLFYRRVRKLLNG